MTAKPAHGVLGGGVDNTRASPPLPPAVAQDTLRDVLLALPLPETRVDRGTDDEAGVEEGLAVAAVGQAADKGKLLSDVPRRQLLGRMIPTILRVEQRFEAQRSPLLRDVLGLPLRTRHGTPRRRHCGPRRGAHARSGGGRAHGR